MAIAANPPSRTKTLRPMPHPRCIAQQGVAWGAQEINLPPA
jgi:hypothetical protein